MAGLRVPMHENKRTQAPGAQSCKAFALGQRGPTEVVRRAGLVCLLSKQQSARLFLPPRWAQGRHFCVAPASECSKKEGAPGLLIPLHSHPEQVGGFKENGFCFLHTSLPPSHTEA